MLTIEGMVFTCSDFSGQEAERHGRICDAKVTNINGAIAFAWRQRQKLLEDTGVGDLRLGLSYTLVIIFLFL